MSEPDRPLFHLEITEDASTGVSIRLRHSGRTPNVLAGIPRDVLRRARPWVWTSYERRVLQKARSMSHQAYRLVRDTLILERSKIVMANMPHRDGPARLSWLERRRLWQPHRDRVHDATLHEKVSRDIKLSEASADKIDPLQGEGPPLSKSLSDAMREATGTAFSPPRTPEPRERSR